MRLPSDMRQTSRLPSKGPSSPSAPKRAKNLHIPGLPRFHPANYSTGAGNPHLAPGSTLGSAISSTNTSPPSYAHSPSPASRTAFQSRQYSDAQRQLYANQRGYISLNNPSGMSYRPMQHSVVANGKRASPRSPRLHPLGSPGPVTPLELEHEQSDEDYFENGGSSDRKQLSEDGKDEIVEAFIQNERSERSRRASDVNSISSAPAHSPHSRPRTVEGLRGDPTHHRSTLSR